MTEACVSSGALKRENAAVKVTTVLDILTDALRKCIWRLPSSKLTVYSHLDTRGPPLAGTDLTPSKACVGFCTMSQRNPDSHQHHQSRSGKYHKRAS